MGNLLRWNPRRELEHLRENVNRILEEGFASVGGSTLPVDIYETEEAVVVEAGPLYGVRAEDIEVTFTGNVLTIQGQTHEKEEQESPAATYLRRERRHGRFSRAVTIPRPVRAEEAVASLKEGILTITIPKSDEARPRVINIEPTES